MSTTLTALPSAPELRLGLTLDRFNIAADARSFDCKFIEPGLVNYKDQGGGLELLRKETLDRCMSSAVGNPLTIGHTMVNAANRTDLEQGIVHEYYFNPENGWYHVKGAVDTDRAKELMKVKRPSCGYRVTSFGPGGVYHGIRYDKEITGIEFNHLAIVDKPRYEDAVFRFNQASMNIYKFLRSLVTRENGADGQPGAEVTKTETVEMTGDTLVTLLDGTQVRVNDLGEMWMKQTKAAVESKQDNNTMVDCGDCGAVKLNELIENYRKNKAMEKEKEKEEMTRKNEAAEKEAAEKKKAEGAAAFNRLSAAPVIAAAPANPTSSGSMAERLALGKKRY